MNNKGVWIVADGKAEVRDVPLGEVGPYDLLIETRACGVCAWDAKLFHGVSAPGAFPYVIGHEGVGIVRQVGSLVRGYAEGDKVFCASGGNQMMVQYFVQNAACCAKLPADTENYGAAVLEPTVCVVNLLEKAGIRPGDHVALVGAGYMGLLTLQGLVRGSWAGRISTFEVRPERLALARKLSPQNSYDPYSQEGARYVEQLKREGGVDVVIEFSASDSGFTLANELIRKTGGTLVIGSWHRDMVTFNGTSWHMSGVSVLNLSPMSNRNYMDLIPRTALLHERGVYQPGDYLTHTARFDDEEALNHVLRISGTKEDGYIKGAILF
ncbi:MAG: zinc-binding dehydrogenase [Christensenellales bacterium]